MIECEALENSESTTESNIISQLLSTEPFESTKEEYDPTTQIHDLGR